MPIRSSKIVTIGLLAIAMVGTATSAFADRNQYTRGRMYHSSMHHMHRMHPMHHPMRMHRMHMMHRRHAM